jgi:hypothetical protein
VGELQISFIKRCWIFFIQQRLIIFSTIYFIVLPLLLPTGAFAIAWLTE